MGCSVNGTGWLSLTQKVRFEQSLEGRKTPGRRESLPADPDSNFIGFWHVPPGSWPPFSVFYGLLKWMQGMQRPD